MNMLRNITTWTSLAIVLSWTGCASKFADIKTETEANPKVRFSAYHTYAWAGAAAAVRDPDHEWTPPAFDIGAEIMFIVNRELRARKMTEVASSPDVLVLYALGVDMKSLDVVTKPGEDTERFKEIPKAGLLVVLTDPKSREVLWVGGAEANLAKKPDTEVAKQRLDYAITKMFKELPE